MMEVGEMQIAHSDNTLRGFGLRIRKLLVYQHYLPSINASPINSEISFRITNENFKLTNKATNKTSQTINFDQ